jgi:4-alpha-glucanotransferase
MKDSRQDLENTVERASGILLHPLSLPGGEGVGTLGREAYAFVDWLARARQKIWQILPLGPTGYGDSPYASFSVFAGNPYMISLRALIKEGDLTKDECWAVFRHPPGRVRYGVLYLEKNALLRLAARRFFEKQNGKLKKRDAARRKDFESFIQREQEWLSDYALFMTAKVCFMDAPWQEWPSEIRLRQDAEALSALKNNSEYNAILYAQWQFSRQWQALRAYAEKRGVSIIGDAPIFVAADSADVWVNRELFQLDENGHALAVAGVPPDYFSPTGQLWGNPLYDWDVLRRDGYLWWKKRLIRLLRRVHCVRIDHFRGFAQYWAVPAGAETAVSGEWRDGPGEDFFTELVKCLGRPLPLIAEDLGFITPDVFALRDTFGLPGMRIFCFAPWGEETWNDESGAARAFTEHTYAPEMYVPQCLAYPGTHDNDTVAGWFAAINAEQRRAVEGYLRARTGRSVLTGADAAQAVVECLSASQAGTVIFQIQDILGLPAEARFNTPGTCDARNWSWRLAAFPDKAVTKWLAKLTKRTKRG